MQHTRDRRQKKKPATARQLADFLLTLGRSHGTQPWVNTTSAQDLLVGKFRVSYDIAARAVSIAKQRATARHST